MSENSEGLVRRTVTLTLLSTALGASISFAVKVWLADPGDTFNEVMETVRGLLFPLAFILVLTKATTVLRGSAWGCIPIACFLVSSVVVWQMLG